MNLNFNAETSNFTGTLTYNHGQYEITLVDFDTDDLEKAAHLATQINNWLNSNLNQVKQFAANALIEDKNSEWLEENEAPVSEEAFMQTIEFKGVLAFSEGSFEIYFNDNDLFWGHTIIVDVDQDFNLSGVNIGG
ncbi:DUF2262 domain-containing protein [Mucilaginibacter rigui]|uniref:DUF2262 domain-containing protein n=1 Tax=Mucilaginibacter rigui TaxID=534635 RepID=A0ABR7X424_9SPHI|nr:DUF2262 domain-containing protein [Mucilaginibacter rigui]MBD1385323.1 DUF2262 domain-containing protein [Mucilaginibacter rigui]